MIVVSCRVAREIDSAATSEYGISETELVRRAGTKCAAALRQFQQRPVAVLAGAGNNAADAFNAAGCLIESSDWKLDELTIIVRSQKELSAITEPQGKNSPSDVGLRNLVGLGAAIIVWDGKSGEAGRAMAAARLVVDGLAGTGISGTPRGATAEIIAVLNALRAASGDRVVVSIDMPSGLSDQADSCSTVVAADATLAIEPIKACLFRPFARNLAGRIIPILGIFPAPLLDETNRTKLVDFAAASAKIPAVPLDAFKHRRGLLEIRAGSVGATGAAKLAVRGATAAGAGLIRLIVDEELWPILASSETGAMVRKASASTDSSPSADAFLIGPGWGVGGERSKCLRSVLSIRDATFVLDADAVRIYAQSADDERLPEGTIITPHPGEFAVFAGCRKEDLEIDPDPVLLKIAAHKNATVILKGHVMRIAAPDGRLTYVDGMEPVLSVGGSGDVLAGLVAGIAARLYRTAKDSGTAYDPFPVAVAAATLLIEAGKRAKTDFGFCDAAEFAVSAGKIAGRAWLKAFPS